MPDYDFDGEELIPADDEKDTGAELEGASAISFSEQVPKPLARALRRVHQNLGHPRREDLVRHLRLAGASDGAIKAAQQLSCQTCRRHAHPAPRRPGKVVRPLDFNEEVGIDVVNLYTVDKQKVAALSILDHASGYHVMRPISGKSSDELAEDFLAAWVSWAS